MENEAVEFEPSQSQTNGHKEEDLREVEIQPRTMNVSANAMRTIVRVDYVLGFLYLVFAVAVSVVAGLTKDDSTFPVYTLTPSGLETLTRFNAFIAPILFLFFGGFQHLVSVRFRSRGVFGFEPYKDQVRNVHMSFECVDVVVSKAFMLCTVVALTAGSTFDDLVLNALAIIAVYSGLYKALRREWNTPEPPIDVMFWIVLIVIDVSIWILALVNGIRSFHVLTSGIMTALVFSFVFELVQLGLLAYFFLKREGKVYLVPNKLLLFAQRITVALGLVFGLSPNLWHLFD
jgi:hypothetical protein